MEKFKEIIEARKPKVPKVPKDLPEGPVTSETYDNHYEYFDSLLDISDEFSIAEEVSSSKEIKKLGGKVKNVEYSVDIGDFGWDGDVTSASIYANLEVKGIKGIDCTAGEIIYMRARWEVEDGEASGYLEYDSSPDQVWCETNGEHTMEDDASDIGGFVEDAILQAISEL